MSIGMSYEDYWYGQPQLAKFYREAEEFRFEQRNRDFWLQGLYVYKAVHSVIDGFGKGLSGSGKPAEKYFEYPIAFTEREKKEEKQRNIKRTLEWVRRGQEGNNGITI